MKFINNTNDSNFIPFEIYKQSIGMGFLINDKNELPIEQHRHTGEKYSKYKYGIDEYILSSLFKIDFFMKIIGGQ